LGTALLRLIIKTALENGCTEIEGNLKPQDLEKNPRLPDWFRHHGFEFQMEADLRLGRVWLELGH
jgi:hypothetical protein